MKQLLFICAFLLYGISSLAEEITVEFYRSCPEDLVKDKRSITLEPTATIDGNTIRIYTNVPISNLQVAIKDSMGNVVYTYNDTTSSRCHTFEVYDLPEGDYTLELKIGEEAFYGDFSVQDDI